ncbi:Methionine aminopeptidase 2 [Chamberlinius hualienensis]
MLKEIETKAEQMLEKVEPKAELIIESVETKSEPVEGEQVLEKLETKAEIQEKSETEMRLLDATVQHDMVHEKEEPTKTETQQSIMHSVETEREVINEKSAPSELVKLLKEETERISEESSEVSEKTQPDLVGEKAEVQMDSKLEVMELEAAQKEDEESEIKQETEADVIKVVSNQSTDTQHKVPEVVNLSSAVLHEEISDTPNIETVTEIQKTPATDSLKEFTPAEVPASLSPEPTKPDEVEVKSEASPEQEVADHAVTVESDESKSQLVESVLEVVEQPEMLETRDTSENAKLESSVDNLKSVNGEMEDKSPSEQKTVDEEEKVTVDSENILVSTAIDDELIVSALSPSTSVTKTTDEVEMETAVEAEEIMAAEKEGNYGANLITETVVSVEENKSDEKSPSATEEEISGDLGATKTSPEEETMTNGVEDTKCSWNDIHMKDDQIEIVSSVDADETSSPVKEYVDVKTESELFPIKEAPVEETQDGDHDSGVDESTQGKDGVEEPSPSKKPSTLTSTPTSSAKAPKKSTSTPKKSPSAPVAAASPAKVPKAPSSTSSQGSTTQDKKLPMNKVVVGTSPSPNLKVVKSKIGSLENARHKAGGGNVKLETKKIDLSSVKSKVGSTDNIQHKPSGGEKKILSRKLEWKGQPKIGSLDNATHKPGGGTKKIETQKLGFKDAAKPKIGSRDNIQHKPGGGALQVKDSLPTSPSPNPPKSDIDDENAVLSEAKSPSSTAAAGN